MSGHWNSRFRYIILNITTKQKVNINIQTCSTSLQQTLAYTYFKYKYLVTKRHEPRRLIILDMGQRWRTANEVIYGISNHILHPQKFMLNAHRESCLLYCCREYCKLLLLLTMQKPMTVAIQRSVLSHEFQIPRYQILLEWMGNAGLKINELVIRLYWLEEHV